MKNKIKGLVCLLLCSLALSSFGQIAVVDYMKVSPGNTGKYLEVEKSWKKIHQARLDAGLILSWSLFQVMFAGSDDDYQYATVTIYKSLDDYEKSFSDKVFAAAFPDAKEKDMDDMMKKTGDSRSLIGSKVFYLVTNIDPKDFAKAIYLTVSTMKVKPGGGDAYVKLEKDWYKPIHASFIKQGTMEGWSIWGKWLGDNTDYQYVAVNSYSSFEQMEKVDYQKGIQAALPGKNPAEIATKTTAARELTATQIWKRVDDVRK